MQTISEKHSVLYNRISDDVTGALCLYLEELSEGGKKNAEKIRQTESLIRRIREAGERWHRGDVLPEDALTESEQPEKTTEDAERESECCLLLLKLIAEASEIILSAPESGQESSLLLTEGMVWSILHGNADALILLFYACSGNMNDRSSSKKMNSEVLKYSNLLTGKREKNYYMFYDRIIEEKISLANQLHKC